MGTIKTVHAKIRHERQEETFAVFAPPLRSLRERLYIVCGVALLLLMASPAYADCMDPPGEEGVMVYNTTHKTMQFCNGTHWIAMGGGIVPGGRESMVEGWPDAIQCAIYNQVLSVNDTLTLYAYYMPYGRDGRYYYRAFEDIQREFGGQLQGITQIGFNADHSFGVFKSSRNSASGDTNYTDAGTCQGKSIADLYAEGKAFNFLGHNGG